MFLLSNSIVFIVNFIFHQIVDLLFDVLADSSLFVSLETIVTYWFILVYAKKKKSKYRAFFCSINSGDIDDEMKKLDESRSLAHPLRPLPALFCSSF
jgi:hypothetical protein